MIKVVAVSERDHPIMFKYKMTLNFDSCFDILKCWFTWKGIFFNLDKFKESLHVEFYYAKTTFS